MIFVKETKSSSHCLKQIATCFFFLCILTFSYIHILFVHSLPSHGKGGKCASMQGSEERRVRPRLWPSIKHLSSIATLNIMFSARSLDSMNAPSASVKFRSEFGDGFCKH